MAALRVLLADNIDGQRDVYEAALHHAGFQVLHARSGVEAIVRARQSVPDLIVLDLQLRDLDGLQVFATLRELPETRAVPVVAVTAAVHRYPPARVLPLGFAACLPKPVDPCVLVATVREQLGDPVLSLPLHP